MAARSLTMPLLSRIAGLCLLVALATGTAACVKVSRERTLPPSIRSVAVPMVINRSAEIGLEEDATIRIQEEFLADGRLEVTGQDRADAVVYVTIKRFNDRIIDFGDGSFPRQAELDLDADVYVVRNEAGQPRIGPNRQVNTRTIVRVDARRTNFEPEPVRRERMLREFARKVVLEVLTGDMAKPEYILEREQREQDQTEDEPPSFL
jgi:hypothetical protein